MDISNLSKVILMPHVSEKSVMIADNVKQQTFKVASTATKKDVKEAIEKLFEVEVIKVNILTVTGKQKQDNKDSYVGFIILLVAGGALLKACDIV